MKFLKLTIVVVFASCAFFACSGGQSPRREFVIADSKSYEASLFRQNCAICHGIEGNGKQLADRLVPSLRYGDAATKTEQEIYDQIANGKLPMPSFKNQLTDEEIKKMVKFIRRDLQEKE